MASTIKLKNGSGAPTTGDLVQGEPALDLTNKRLYTENASGVVIEVGTNPSTIDINAGTIDGTVIGGTTAAAGTFTTGQFNTSLNVDGTTNLDVVDIDGAVDMASTLTVGGTTNDGTTLAQIVQSGTGRAFSVNRNVASATRAVVNLAQLQASGGAEAVLDIQQTTPASRAIKVTPDGSIDRFSVYGTGALVTTPVAGGHAVFNEGGADADFRVESDTANTHALFVEGSSSNVGIGAGSPTTSLTLGTGTTGVSFQSGSLALNSGKIAVIKPIEVGTGNGHLVFETYEGGSGGGERMRIDSTGNVGIGDSSPSVKLDVYQSTVGVGVVDFRHVNGNRILINPSYNYYDAYNHIFRGLNGTDTHMTIDDSGNVGIGTSSPTSGGGLTLSSSTTAQGFIDFKHTVDGDSGFIGNAKALVTGGTTNQLGVRGGTSGIAFSVGAAEAARIDSAGNVGIGVSPSQKLHVAGNIVLDAAGFVGFGGGTNYIEGSATNLLKFGTANVERMRIDSSGRVTMPYQPAFNVNPLSDQNNIAINTPVTVIFNTEVFDVGSNFASNTFTAPVTGKYQLNLALRLHNIDTAADFYQIKFLTSNRSYLSTADYGVLSSNPNYWTEAFSVLADMDANDTVSITVSQSGGSVQTDIHVETTFSGYLVA
jgi:hypothetical protein